MLLHHIQSGKLKADFLRKKIFLSLIFSQKYIIYIIYIILLILNMYLSYVLACISFNYFTQWIETKNKNTVAQTGPEINNVKIPNCDKNILTLNSIENFKTRSRISFCTSALASSKPQLSDSWKKLTVSAHQRQQFCDLVHRRPFIANSKCSKNTPPFLFG